MSRLELQRMLHFRQEYGHQQQQHLTPSLDLSKSPVALRLVACTKSKMERCLMVALIYLQVMR